MRKWREKQEQFKNTKEKEAAVLRDFFNRKRREIRDNEWDAAMKEQTLKLFDELHDQDAADALNAVGETREIYQKVMDREEENLQQAKDAQNRWAQAAYEQTLQVIAMLGEMVKTMTVRNKQNLAFPLFRLKNEPVLSPDEIKAHMRDLFQQTLRHVEDKGLDVDYLKKSELGTFLSMGSIVHVAYGYKFPRMQVYNVNTDNTFWLDQPRERYYDDWEVFLQGSEESSTGSGGQRLAAFTLLSIMITTQKRKRNKNVKKSVLINDNPFANAISAHVLDPIFKVADALGVQWIVVAPPELVKSEVSERFPAYYGLTLERMKNGKDFIRVENSARMIHGEQSATV